MDIRAMLMTKGSIRATKRPSDYGEWNPWTRYKRHGEVQQGLKGPPPELLPAFGPLRGSAEEQQVELLRRALIVRRFVEAWKEQRKGLKGDE